MNAGMYERYISAAGQYFTHISWEEKNMKSHQRAKGKNLARTISMILALILVLCLVPVAAMAAEGSEVAEDGTYTANGTVKFSKDNYGFKLTLTVSDGKIASMSQTITTSTEESKSKTSYQPKAMSALSSKLIGKAATTDSVDAVSSGTPKYSFAALKAAARQAIVSAPAVSTGTGEETGGESGGESGSESGSEGGYTPVTESEIGKGIGSQTGTKYVGTGTIGDEYVTLDVYVDNGKIAGLFIAAEEGDWLSLLTEESSKYIGKDAVSSVIDAVSCATQLNFRKTIRDAVAAAVAQVPVTPDPTPEDPTPEDPTPEDPTPEDPTPADPAAESYVVDGYSKNYSYSALCSGEYYYLYNDNYYQVNGLKYTAKKGNKTYYCGYFVADGTTYYLADTPQAYSDNELVKACPGTKNAKKAYKSCNKNKVSQGKNLPLYTAE